MTSLTEGNTIELEIKGESKVASGLGYYGLTHVHVRGDVEVGKTYQVTIVSDEPGYYLAEADFYPPTNQEYEPASKNDLLNGHR